MRRWVSEPLLAGVIAIALYLAWMLSYSWQLASTGVEPSGGAYTTAWDFTVRMVSGVAAVAVVIAIWVVLAAAGVYLVRRRSFPWRLMMAWLGAVALCLPFVVASAASLSASDGWRGLGVISFLIPVMAPLAVVPLYSAAATLLWIRDRRNGRNLQVT